MLVDRLCQTLEGNSVKTMQWASESSDGFQHAVEYMVLSKIYIPFICDEFYTWKSVHF